MIGDNGHACSRVYASSYPAKEFPQEGVINKSFLASDLLQGAQTKDRDNLILVKSMKAYNKKHSKDHGSRSTNSFQKIVSSNDGSKYEG